MNYSQDLQLLPEDVLSRAWSKVREYLDLRMTELNNKLMSCSTWDEYVAVKSKIQELGLLYNLQEKQEMIDE